MTEEEFHTHLRELRANLNEVLAEARTACDEAYKEMLRHRATKLRAMEQIDSINGLLGESKSNADWQGWEREESTPDKHHKSFVETCRWYRSQPSQASLGGRDNDGYNMSGKSSDFGCE